MNDQTSEAMEVVMTESDSFRNNSVKVSALRANYLKSRLFIDMTTSVSLLGGSPVGITRVETKLVASLLEATHLNPFPVVLADDGSIRALETSTARKILKLWEEQREIKLTKRGIAKSEDIPVIAESRHRDSLESLGKIEKRERKKFFLFVLRRIFRQPRKVLTGKLTLEMIASQFFGRSRDETKGIPLPFGEAHSLLRQEIVESAELLVQPTSRDFLWTAGLYSHFSRPRALLELKSKFSFQIGCLLYDAIRIIHSEYNPKELNRDVHLAYTRDLLEAADLPLAISSWTKDTMVELARAEGFTHNPITVLQLGVDVSHPTLTVDQEEALRNALTQRPFALCVGTIEPRKNINHLLDVWSKLAEVGIPSLDLVLVGKQGYGAELDGQRLQQHPLFGKHVFWLDSCPDKALTSLYKMSTLVVCPSISEGWGLPVSEALLHGRPVVASNTSAHPEAGFGAAILLPVSDRQIWVDTIKSIAASPDGFKPDLSQVQVPSWEIVGKRLVEILEVHTNRDRANEGFHAHSSN